MLRVSDAVRPILMSQSGNIRALQRALLSGDWTQVSEMLASAERSQETFDGSLILGTRKEQCGAVYVVLDGKIDVNNILVFASEVDNKPSPAAIAERISIGAELMDRREIGKAVHEWRLAPSRERCGLAHRGGCMQIINAHTLQEASLREMCSTSDPGHVFTFQYDTSGNIDLKRCGVGKVNAYRSMCQKHDDEAFRAFESNPFSNSEDQIRTLHLKGLVQRAYMYDAHTEARVHFRAKFESNPEMLEKLKLSREATFQLSDELKKAAERVDAGAPLWWATWIGDGIPNVAGLESSLPPWLDGPWDSMELDSENTTPSPSTFFLAPKKGKIVACLIAERGDTFIQRVAKRIDAVKPNRRAYMLQRLVVMNCHNPVFSSKWMNSTSTVERDRAVKMNQLRKLVDIPSWVNGPLLHRLRNT